MCPEIYTVGSLWLAGLVGASIGSCLGFALCALMTMSKESGHADEDAR